MTTNRVRSNAASTLLQVLAAASSFALAACAGTVSGDGEGGRGAADPATSPDRGAPTGEPGPGPSGSGGAGPPGGMPTGGSPSPNPPPGVPVPPREEGYSGPVACNRDGAVPGPRRLWRLTAAQYRNTIAVAFNGAPLAAGQKKPDLGFLRSSPFDLVASGDRYSTVAASYTMSDAEFRKLFDQAEEASLELVRRLRAQSGTCLAARKPFAECARELVTHRGRLLWRRPLDAVEIDQVTRVATDAMAALMGNENEALALAFQALLMSPSFVYRAEVGAGAPDAKGSVRLSAHEVASALAFTITDNPPDAELSRAADDGALGTPELVAAQARRLLGNLADRGPLTAFMREYFQYPKAATIFKDTKLFANHRPARLIDDTNLFVANVLRTAGTADFVKTLLTTAEGFVHRETFSAYGIAKPMQAPNDESHVKVAFPSDQRAGILTQPSLLVAFSQPERTDPVQRGRFVAESLLCVNVPQLPIDQVPDLTDLGPNATVRDRLKMHTADPKCSVCHKLMDPIGLGFESYDHLGRYRTAESGRPVDNSGVLVGGGDGPFRGAVELAGKLAAMPAVEECFVRHTLRYFYGREERAADGCAIADAHAAYKRGGGSFLAALEALFTSPLFLSRSTTSPTSK